MRESTSLLSRTPINKENKKVKNKKYFLIFEGKKTEDIYFKAIDDLRSLIHLNPLIVLIPIIKSYSEKGFSNPKKLLDSVIQNIKEKSEQKISSNSLIDMITDYIYEIKAIITNKYAVQTINKKIKQICEETLNLQPDDIVENIEEVCTTILKELSFQDLTIDIAKDLPEILKSKDITYEKDSDEICLIVDRDKNSFLSSKDNNQYEYVLKTCKNEGFLLCITNPCFEFWLLLHDDKVFSLDKDCLLNNKKNPNTKETYTEEELKKVCPTFNKSQYDAYSFVKNVNKAIENEKSFCENLSTLEKEVGSNIGRLIETLQGKDKSKTFLSI